VAKEGLRRQCLFPIRENPRYPWLKFPAPAVLRAPMILSNMILSIPPPSFAAASLHYNSPNRARLAMNLGSLLWIAGFEVGSWKFIRG
jgi:hypothetical protein